ncbi:MAG: hypothetical protein J6M53_00885 [Bacteroidaceae bacterium]|nr:hypothetical protein [Bacteroidaceae bacterium]
MKRTILALVLLCALAVACSEHTYDAKYRSDCPRFAALSTSTETVTAGVPVVLTCVEQRAGKLLDRTTYTWTVMPAEGLSIETSVPAEGVYDGVSPTATVTFPAPGNYTVTFRGDYRGSGQVNYFEESETLADGTTARYSANTGGEGSNHRDYLHAQLTRRIVVK